MSDATLRVVKLGGSLLDFAELVPRLRRWLAAGPAATTVLVVGGGRLVDVLRRMHQHHGLRSATAHWLCVDTMGINARLVEEILPGAEWAGSLADVERQQASGRVLILDPVAFCRQDDPARSAKPLPETWEVTSDSIAARAAELLGADELVLLKSTLPPEDASLESAAASGYVDGYFPKAAASLHSIRCVNLRDESFPERRWR